MAVYIYGLFDPRNLELRYIGKSKKPDRRLNEHILDAKREKKFYCHKDNWIRLLLSEGLEPAIEILEECDSNWEESERIWISECKRFGLNLTNKSAGGDNPPTWNEMHNPELAKSKVAESNRRRNPPNIGRKWSDEYKDKMRESLSGQNNPMFGKFGNDHPATGRIVSNETRHKLSIALKGNNNPMYGKTHTDETRAKLSLAGKGRKQTEDDKKKKSLSGKMNRALKKGLSQKVLELQKEYFNLFGCYHSGYQY